MKAVRDISHLDCAYGGSDSTAFTCARLRGNALYLYGRLWHAHVNRVLDECIAEADRHLCWPLYCEDNGDHGFVVTEIRRRDHFGKTYHEDQNKFVKISTYLQYWWPNIHFIEGTDPTPPRHGVAAPHRAGPGWPDARSAVPLRFRIQITAMEPLFRLLMSAPYIPQNTIRILSRNLYIAKLESNPENNYLLAEELRDLFEQFFGLDSSR